MLSNRITERLANHQTPFYLYDMNLLRATLEKLNSASGKHGYTVHYAIKANFDDRILACVREYGLGVDCVSGNEVRKAIESGFPADKVVYAGVGKTDKEIIYSLEQGIFAFNCESRQELEVINEFAGSLGVKARVALRINPDVDPMTHEYISTGQGDSKFGISYKEIDQVIEQLGSLSNIKITGLHFHVGSQITELRVFEHLCKRVNTIYEWFAQKGFEFTHVNVGGGLGVNYQAPEQEQIPDFETYFEIFSTHLNLDPKIEVHFELGRSIVAQCGELITKVMFTKTTSQGNNYAIVDASMTDLLRPALYGAHHAMELLTSAEGRPESTYTIVGTVCESSDIFARNIKITELKRGDMLTLKTAGAYGASMASNYNMHDLPAAVYSDDL